ncbi:hypothetical protein [Izhakiella australiensis]|uniref:hypothetical protein n=1 Tax=Izhakiella australiensis TaxID=1926881 RepID=UPI0011159287|nr:hypothetical protein [Izhakiella australiensis]
MFKKEIPLVTIALIFSYALAYTFQKGMASFYGFPSDFIAIDINVLVTSFFSVALIAVAFLGLLPLDIYNLEMTFFRWVVIFVFICLLSFVPFIFSASESYAKIHLERRLYLSIIVFSLSLVFLISVTYYWIKGARIVTSRRIIVVTFSAVSLSMTLGWISAYWNSTIYYVGENTYVITSFSGKYVFASCKKDKAVYHIGDLDKSVSVEAVSRKVSDEIKVCLNNSANNSY